MTFALIFAVCALAYWGLRAADYRTTRAAEALGGVEGNAAVRGADGLLAVRPFVVQGLCWSAIAGVFFVAALLTHPAVHALWLGMYGVLLVRSARAILGNREWVREHGGPPRAGHLG